MITNLFFFDSGNSSNRSSGSLTPGSSNDYVILSFDNLQEGWGYISKEVEKEINSRSSLPRSIEILHDTEFEIEIMKRAVKSCAEQYFGIISKTELDNRLGKNGNFNSYLLDFEFNHFSETEDKLYISRLKSNCSPICNQTTIAKELMNIHDFPTLVGHAVFFIECNKNWLEKQDKTCIPELLFHFEDITLEYLHSKSKE